MGAKRICFITYFFRTPTMKEFIMNFDIKKVVLLLAVLVLAAAMHIIDIAKILAPAKDHDHDGYSEIAGDCNDKNPNIHPTVLDVPYDGIDENCDRQNDFDLDRDGCSSPGDDCDDDNPAIHPYAIEIWYNGIDEDCDGNDDDKDNDGYPRGDQAGQDCNDDDPNIYPWWNDEKPGDGVDSDCDGLDYATVEEEVAAGILENIDYELGRERSRADRIFGATVTVETYRSQIPVFNQNLSRDQGRNRYGCQYDGSIYTYLAESLDTLGRYSEAQGIRFAYAWILYQNWDYCADQNRTEPNWFRVIEAFTDAGYPGLARQAQFDGAKAWLDKNDGEGNEDKVRKNLAQALRILETGLDKKMAEAWVTKYARRQAKENQIPARPVDESP